MTAPSGAVACRLAVLGLAIVLAGCPLAKKRSTAGDDDGAAPQAASAGASGTGAKNEATVLRYPEETPLPHVPAIIGRDGSVVRNFPGNGPQIVILSKGAPVVKIASYSTTGVLVLFDDPSNDGSKLIGWVSPKVFDSADPAPSRPVVVPKVDGGTVKDAGVTTLDAGHPSIPVDAGGGGGGASTDAGGGGGGLPQPRPGQVAVPPVDGKCPDGWAIAESMCRKKCSVDADCFRNTKCVAKGTMKVCSSDAH